MADTGDRIDYFSVVGRCPVDEEVVMGDAETGSLGGALPVGFLGRRKGLPLARGLSPGVSLMVLTDRRRAEWWRAREPNRTAAL